MGTDWLFCMLLKMLKHERIFERSPVAKVCPDDMHVIDYWTNPIPQTLSRSLFSGGALFIHSTMDLSIVLLFTNCSYHYYLCLHPCRALSLARL